jgi:hypothetical protein
MRRSFMTCARPLLAVGALLGVASVRVAQADTTVPITGIGTSVTGGFVINTHADSVTYSDPVDVVINGMAAVEIRGTVSGVGWGGSGIVARAANAHYSYKIPFVARWRKDGPRERLVFYNHGGGLSVIAAVKRDKQAGAANANRFAELIGDLQAGVPALLDHAAYISINRRGLRGDGTFSASYLPPVPPLTAAEVAAIEADLATTPGNATFQQPGIAAGAPVPVLPTNDAATCRDIARALEQVVAGILGRPFRTRIGIGASSGAMVFAAFNFGRSVIDTQSVRTGGNNVVPYDIGSPRIFDAFIFNGFPYTPGVVQADPAFPLSAPAMFFQGQGDERYQQHVTMAYELLQKGVVLNGSVWLYDVKNLTHVTRDSVLVTTQPSTGDCLGCFMSAAIRNLRAFLEQGKPPPPSRMAGRIIGGALRFDQADGSTTNVAPVPNDPTIDSYVVDANLTPRPIGSAETTRWLAVTAALPHVGDAITPPTVACRLGGYKLIFFGSQLMPFAPAVLAAKYGSFECYRACVCQTVCCLEAQGLYDPRVESARETAELARALFEPTYRSRSTRCKPWPGKAGSFFMVRCRPRSW